MSRLQRSPRLLRREELLNFIPILLPCGRSLYRRLVKLGRAYEVTGRFCRQILGENNSENKSRHSGCLLQIETHVVRPPRNFAAAQQNGSHSKSITRPTFDARVVLKFAHQGNKINQQDLGQFGGSTHQ